VSGVGLPAARPAPDCAPAGGPQVDQASPPLETRVLADSGTCTDPPVQVPPRWFWPLGEITAAGDTISIELVEAIETPSTILLVWPAAPSVSDPRKFGTVANAVVAILAQAKARLATINAADLQPRSRQPSMPGRWRWTSGDPLACARR